MNDLRPDAVEHNPSHTFGSVFKASLLNGEAKSLPWLREIKQKSFQRFTDRGLPTLRDEEWRYTSLRDLREKAYAFAVAPSSVGESEDLLSINGVFSKPKRNDGIFTVRNLDQLNSVEIQRVSSIIENIREQLPEPTPDLASALINNAISIDVKKNASKNEEPIQLNIGHSVEHAGGLSFDHLISVPTIFLHVHAGSRLVINECFSGENRHPALFLPIVYAYLEEGAELRWSVIQDLSDDCKTISHRLIDVQKDAKFSQFNFDHGANLARHHLNVNLAGKGASARLHAMILADKARCIDHHTVVDHLSANTQSAQLYKSIALDESRVVFSGKVHVREAAQQSCAHQLSKNLLLGSHAEINAKPELKIDADDVKCSHGATISQLDDNQAFYLASRGIQKQVAERMLVGAFLREVLDQHTMNDSERAHIEQLIVDFFEARSGH